MRASGSNPNEKAAQEEKVEPKPNRPLRQTIRDILKDPSQRDADNPVNESRMTQRIGKVEEPASAEKEVSAPKSEPKAEEQPKEKEASAPQAAVCPSCGYPLRPGSLTCPKCNTSVAARTIHDKPSPLKGTVIEVPPTAEKETASAQKNTVYEGNNPQKGTFFQGKDPQKGTRYEGANPQKATRYEGVNPLRATRREGQFPQKGTINEHIDESREPVKTPNPSPAEPKAAEVVSKGTVFPSHLSDDEPQKGKSIRMTAVNVGERSDFAPIDLEFSDKEVVLNRGNVAPNDLTISRSAQALLTCEDGHWYLENKSRLLTTSLVLDKKHELQDGDIVIIGDKMFRIGF
ncbi:MAG: zinc ribbon domain-containing protein [Bacteroidales bacterium]|nr:zinc ribbon domain-containing protein [Bacteroidales bacterium]